MAGARSRPPDEPPPPREGWDEDAPPPHSGTGGPAVEPPPERRTATLHLPEPSGGTAIPNTGRSNAGRSNAGKSVARRWPATVRTGYLGAMDGDAWPVGFSPTGEALPDALTDVLLRGSHAIRSAKRAEAQRRERATAIAAHVDSQIDAFLAMCAEEELVPPMTVRVIRDVPRLARTGHRDGRPRAAVPMADEASGRPAPPKSSRATQRHRRRERLRAWPVLYWRCESFPSAARSLHLFVEPGGRTFEGRDDPGPLTVLGQQPRVWPVDAASIVEGMAEVDARRAALHLVHGMAHLLWRAGIGL